MNKLINAIAGENAAPAKKYAVIAALATAAALIVAVVVLSVSSIVFAIKGGPEGEAPASDGGGDVGVGVGGGVSSSIEYTSVSKDEIMGKVDGSLVDVQENRTKLSDDKKYYDAYRGQKLTKGAQKAVDSMLIAYYTATEDNNIYIGAKGCGDEKYDSGNVVGISKSDAQSYLDATPINTTDNKWIFDNAYRYGFIYSGNTFTYVGVPAATYMKGGVTLDTLVKNTQSKTVSVSAMAVGATKATSYQIYCITKDATDIKLPSNYSYTVNAVDGGYIVAVDMSTKKAAAAQ